MLTTAVVHDGKACAICRALRGMKAQTAGEEIAGVTTEHRYVLVIGRVKVDCHVVKVW